MLLVASLSLAAACARQQSPRYPWQYPIHLGDTRAQVHALLGAASRSDSILEEYPASGVTLWFDQNNRVTKLNFIGQAAECYRTTSEQMLSDQALEFGLTANSNESSFRQAFGKPRVEECDRRGSGTAAATCGRKRDTLIDGLFFVREYGDKPPPYPPGTLVWFEIYRGLSWLTGRARRRLGQRENEIR